MFLISIHSIEIYDKSAVGRLAGGKEVQNPTGVHSLLWCEPVSLVGSRERKRQSLYPFRFEDGICYLTCSSLCCF